MVPLCRFCPVCTGDRWRAIGSRQYRLAEYKNLSPYIQKRYRVLFELWVPDAEEISVTAQLCLSCGLVIYTPRPSAAEIDAKYRFLAALEPDESLGPTSPFEKQRAQHLYRYVASHRGVRSKDRVLDFGGGDGRLMSEFLRRGHSCDLVDYCQTPVSGVSRIASTQAEIPATLRYELIVASHIIEHVADPLPVTVALNRHLKPDGHLFVEVPMEIWGRPPLQEEPVTHVNFFTPASLRRLLEEAGLRVIGCSLAGVPSSPNRNCLAIRALGTPGKNVTLKSSSPGAAETLRFLKPTLALKLRRHFLMPRNIPAAVAHKARRLGERVERTLSNCI